MLKAHTYDDRLAECRTAKSPLRKHANSLGRAQTTSSKSHAKNYYQELPSEVKTRLATMMLNIAEEEARLESQRNKLCVQNLFEPYSAFSRIDRDGKGFITARDVGKYLDNLGFKLMES